MGTVLVTDTSSADSAEAVTALVAAGHEIVRCFPAGASDVSCAYVATGRCPVDHDDVDVVLDVRIAAPGRLIDREQGVVCALRAGIPAVVATDTAWDNPLWQATTTVSVADAAAAVTAALSTIPIGLVARRVAAAVVSVVSLSAQDPKGLAADVVVVRDSVFDIAVNVRWRPPVEVRLAARSAADRVANEQSPPMHIGSIVYTVARNEESDARDAGD